MVEERTAATNVAAGNTPVKLKRNASYVIRRDSEVSAPSSPVLSSSPLSLASPITPPHVPNSVGPTVYTPQGVPITLPVITDANYVFVTTSPLSLLNSTMTYSPKRHGYPNSSPKNHHGYSMNESYHLYQDQSPPGLNSTFSTMYPKTVNTTLTRSPRVHVTPPRTLNSTFVHSPDDISGSNGSIHNTSVDEIHSMARMQEECEWSSSLNFSVQ
jgi:hypothetical protein